jgi:hypothetical protein
MECSMLFFLPTSLHAALVFLPAKQREGSFFSLRERERERDFKREEKLQN